MGSIGTRPLVQARLHGRLNVFCEPTGLRSCPAPPRRRPPGCTSTARTRSTTGPDTGTTPPFCSAFSPSTSPPRCPAPPPRRRGERVCVAGLHTGRRHNKVHGTGQLLINLPYACAADGDAEPCARSKKAAPTGWRCFARRFAPLTGVRPAPPPTPHAITRLEWLKRGLPALRRQRRGEEAVLASAGPGPLAGDEPAFTCDAIWMAGVPDAFTVVFGPGDLAANQRPRPRRVRDRAELDGVRRGGLPDAARLHRAPHAQSGMGEERSPVSVLVDHDDLLAFASGVFTSLGLPAAAAAAAAEALCYGDLTGLSSHGLANLTRLYLPLFESGRCDPGAGLTVLADRGASRPGRRRTLAGPVGRGRGHGPGGGPGRPLRHRDGRGPRGHPLRLRRAPRRARGRPRHDRHGRLNCGRQRIARPAGRQARHAGHQSAGGGGPGGQPSAVPTGHEHHRRAHRPGSGRRPGRGAGACGLAGGRSAEPRSPTRRLRPRRGAPALAGRSLPGRTRASGSASRWRYLPPSCPALASGPRPRRLSGDGGPSGRDDDIGFFVAAIDPPRRAATPAANRRATPCSARLLDCPPVPGKANRCATPAGTRRTAPVGTGPRRPAVRRPVPGIGRGRGRTRAAVARAARPGARVRRRRARSRRARGRRVRGRGQAAGARGPGEGAHPPPGRPGHETRAVCQQVCPGGRGARAGDHEPVRDRARHPGRTASASLVSRRCRSAV